ncbi:MAG: hypothetical protein EOO62_13030, partial [Hymenobacter sp.]
MNPALFPFLHFFTRQQHWLLSGLLLLLPLLGWGQVATYNIANGTGNNVASLAATDVAAGVTASALTKNIISTSTSSNAFRGSGWPTTATIASPPAASFGYISFTITPGSGTTYTITSFTYGIGSSGTGPANYQWRSSADGYASAINGTTLSTTVQVGSTFVLPAAFANLTGAVTFRLYGYKAGAAGGTGGLAGDLTINGSIAGSTPPSLTATPSTAFTAFATSVGTPSAAQTYALTGTNVTAATTVTAPGGFAVSLDGTTYAASVSAPAAAVNSTSGQPIYVRLTGAAAGTFSGNVTNTSGAAAVPVAVSGTTAASPALTVGTIGAGFNTLAGAPSAAQTYALSGTNLTDNVLVTAPAGFEVSLSGVSADYATTKTVLQSGGAASATVYVRLVGTGANAFGGNVTNASAGATTRTVAVTGTVVGRPTGTPTVAAGTLTFNSATLTLGAADGTNLLVVVRPA